MNLKNNIALVTGGASGLGRATVEHFVTCGAKVAILDINDDNAKEVVELLGKDNVSYFNTNVMEEESVQNTINSIAETYGKLNFVVNCAGTGYGARILGKHGPHPLDIFKLIIDLNLVGTFNVMEAAKKQNVKHLLMASTSSVYGSNIDMPFKENTKSDTQLTIYAATKKATESMAHSYSNIWKIPITMLRFFTAYGPW